MSEIVFATRRSQVVMPLTSIGPLFPSINRSSRELIARIRRRDNATFFDGTRTPRLAFNAHELAAHATL